ncbi:MAG: histidine phosphatase family protein [Deltaproteobacteria bacterium]|nr:histidine phosphatase family protein [Deltaproteobacteria bacterium]MBW2392940.1 histidine phosphatase family protein [Deltaproteobacteria bacterium]
MTPSEGKRLWLWRHAKAGAGDPRETDAERHLTQAGTAAAAAMAEAFLTERPDLVLCSPASRTRETLQQAEANWTDAPVLRIEQGLYLAEALDLLERISRVEEEIRSVLVIGHQPGLGELVRLLVQSGEPAALTAFARGFPTAGLAELRLDIPFWREVCAECAFLTAFSTKDT